jgi:hypothetical protein
VRIAKHRFHQLNFIFAEQKLLAPAIVRPSLRCKDPFASPPAAPSLIVNDVHAVDFLILVMS